VGSHAKGNNATSVGICMIGTDKFTPAQWHSLKQLVVWLKAQFPPAAVIGHRDLTAVTKSCPGFDVISWWADGGIPDDKHILQVA
jgi:N-acetyl-anhydromuramyl-L-alanine amidase AmpD